VYLFVKNKNLRLGFEDIGSGISYIFPILTSLWDSKLSFIEQPELHLHPKAQCEFGDVFISAFNRGNIAVIESHSEHLILRILRRIRETTNGILIPKELKINCDEVSIYYFEPQPEGHTEVKKIRLDRHGELMDIWPNGFFSERDSELFL
jgi:predicted ATPase